MEICFYNDIKNIYRDKIDTINPAKLLWFIIHTKLHVSMNLFHELDILMLYTESFSLPYKSWKDNMCISIFENEVVSIHSFMFLQKQNVSLFGHSYDSSILKKEACVLTLHIGMSCLCAL